MQAANFYLQMASEKDRPRVLGDRRKYAPSPGQRIFIGVTDPIDPRVETAEQVRDRVLEAAALHRQPRSSAPPTTAASRPSVTTHRRPARLLSPRSGLGSSAPTWRRTSSASEAPDGSAPACWFNPSVRRPGPTSSEACWRRARSGPSAIAACGGGGGSGAVGGRRAAVRRGGRGIDHRYDGDFQFFVGGGVAAFDCDDDGRATCTSPAAASRRRSTATTANRAVHCTSPAGARRSPTSPPSPAPTRSTSTVTDTPTLRCCASARTSSCAASATVGSSGPTSRSGSTAATAWTVAFSATWEGANELPTLAFGDYLGPDRETCEDSRLLRPNAAGDPTRRRSP